jgi:hypothetical protein
MKRMLLMLASSLWQNQLVVRIDARSIGKVLFGDFGRIRMPTSIAIHSMIR